MYIIYSTTAPVPTLALFLPVGVQSPHSSSVSAMFPTSSFSPDSAMFPTSAFSPDSAFFPSHVHLSQQCFPHRQFHSSHFLASNRTLFPQRHGHPSLPNGLHTVNQPQSQCLPTVHHHPQSQCLHPRNCCKWACLPKSAQHMCHHNSHHTPAHMHPKRNHLNQNVSNHFIIHSCVYMYIYVYIYVYVYICICV